MGPLQPYQEKFTFSVTVLPFGIVTPRDMNDSHPDDVLKVLEDLAVLPGLGVGWWLSPCTLLFVGMHVFLFWTSMLIFIVSCLVYVTKNCLE